MNEEYGEYQKEQWKDSKSINQASIFFFILIILQFPISVLLGRVQSILPERYDILVSLLMTQGYLLLSAIVFILVTKKRWGEDLQVKKYRLSTFFLSFVVLLTAAPMATWFNVLSQFFAKNNTSTSIYSISQNVPPIVGIIIIGCLPGFIEETIYRGIMYSAFRKRSILTGIIVSAFSFGIMHGNFNQMMYAVYLGVVFALLVEATGSLVSTMILHMTFNAINTSYIYLLPYVYNKLAQFDSRYADADIAQLFDQETDVSVLTSTLILVTPVAIAGLVCTILLIKLIGKLNQRPITWKRVCEKTPVAEQTKPVNVWLLVGWGICLGLCILDLIAP